MFEPVTYGSKGAKFLPAVNNYLTVATSSLDRLNTATNSLTYDGALETIWYRWIALEAGDISITAQNNGTDLVSPNIGLYRMHDPTKLVGLFRAIGEGGSCSLVVSGAGSISVGGLYTICIDKMLKGRSTWGWFQDEGELETMPDPVFTINGGVMSLAAGEGSPENTSLFYRIKNQALPGSFESPSKWIKYWEPVKLIQNSYTLQAQANADGFNSSAIVEQAISI